MDQLQADVRAFMLEMGQRVRSWPMNITDLERQLRIDLITEEFDETIDALLLLGNPGISPGRELALIAKVADGAADLMYVLLGTTLAFGIDMTEVWDEVQRANMEKTLGPVREDGKRLKPEGWQEPQVERIIRDQRQAHQFADKSINP